MSAAPTWLSYSQKSQNYDQFRPRYPEAAVELVVANLVDGQNDHVFADVGAGTGIFTRQLASRLGSRARVIGIEPNDEMRNHAVQLSAGFPQIEFLKGQAESVPIDSSSLTVVTAATAATQFNRPPFYREASRILKACGILSLLHNKHRYWENDFLAEFESFRERILPGYKRGTFADHLHQYKAVNFAAELEAEAAFTAVVFYSLPWSTTVTSEAFIGFCLSMGYMTRVTNAMGLDNVRKELTKMTSKYSDSDGRLTIDYVTEVTLAFRV
ncbi:class I SAM-dependent methyltransferase [Sinorhizobium meliloti]|uniref:class I SAM-dependent methyltransferase n=1 Tax=Rhizobium meliloti TaxID=382 RepID=UPI000FD8B707|nr:class I SAM-dependent methyltransferase [Sinorhizobium meliloti]RVG26264.1 class I SAM-dependent methyltransferase [Sinorhizobium meliloti]